jgi:hypothetical protein
MQDQCECAPFKQWGNHRCDKQAKYTILAYAPLKWPENNKPDLSQPAREVRVCGTHKNLAERGGEFRVYKGRGTSSLYGCDVYYLLTIATDVNKLKKDVANAERDEQYKRGDIVAARRRAADTMYEKADEALELLYMVAETGDDRAWNVIDAIVEGKERVRQAEQDHKDVQNKIETLNERIAETKRSS